MGSSSIRYSIDLRTTNVFLFSKLKSSLEENRFKSTDLIKESSTHLLVIPDLAILKSFHK